MIEKSESFLQRMSFHMRYMHPVTVSYFSDSLVLSANVDDPIASQTILELLAKLSIKLWDEHKLLLRGGISLGALVHVENGPLFGPAMNKAYYLESKEANTPRIIFDQNAIEAYRNVNTFEILEPLIKSDANYSYMSLPSCFNYITTSSTLAFSESEQLKTVKLAESFLLENIEQIICNNPPERIKYKYEWLRQETLKFRPSLSSA